MAKNLVPGPIFSPLAQIWPQKIFFVDFTYTICRLSLCAASRKTYQPNLRKWQKPSFGPNFGPFGPNLGCQFILFYFFFKNLAPSVTRYYGQLSSCKISEKTNDPILRKLSDGRMDGRTDGRESASYKISIQQKNKNNINIG